MVDVVTGVVVVTICNPASVDIVTCSVVLVGVSPLPALASFPELMVILMVNEKNLKIMKLAK